jgi:phenylalanyl-tRNA synthetase beta chain
MALITISYSELCKFCDLPRERVEEDLTRLGVPIEKFEADELALEITPNRPDMLCVEGVGRALAAFSKKSVKNYKIEKSQISLSVDPSVSQVRPFIGMAAVYGAALGESGLLSMIQLQEKLHDTLGRKRRKVAIGLHNLDKIASPFKYAAVEPDSILFIPLDKTQPMTPKQILTSHEKGVAYAHLVPGSCPMITDSGNNVLSFPPIINGELTRVTAQTTNLLIDATGANASAVSQAVNIIAAALADRGGQVQSIKINSREYPVLKEKKMKIPVASASKLLGAKLNAKQAADSLRLLGHRVSGTDVYMPGYRADVIHEVDLIEDIAIALDYNAITPTLPNFFEEGSKKAEAPYHDALVGLGFLETVSWHLTNEPALARARYSGPLPLKIQNPLTQDYTHFRPSLLQNLLSILAESKNEKTPQKIYEEGVVALPSLENRLACAILHSKASFSDIKSVLMAVAQSLGVQNVELKPEPNTQFIAGRCGGVYFDGKPVGYIGEITPYALADFGIEQPIAAFEIKVK